MERNALRPFLAESRHHQRPCHAADSHVSKGSAIRVI